MARIIAVGDECQSIYGFRGADHNAIPNLVSALNAKILPLSISYRLPKAHVSKLLNEFPNCGIECAPNAINGEILNVDLKDVQGHIKEGDFILCRTNAPLVSLCFKLIANKIKANIMGRDIGEGLINFIDSFKESNSIKLIEAINIQRQEKVNKFLSQNRESQAVSFDDKCNICILFLEEFTSVEHTKTEISKIFSDSKNAVCLSTIHRAKGLEAERVFILRPDLLPHPMGIKTVEGQKQENNIKFVAYSRSKNILIFVHGKEERKVKTEEKEEEKT